MNITILGAGGFLGRRIAAKLAADGTLGGKPVERLTLFDMTEPPRPNSAFPVRTVTGDVAELPAAAIPDDTDVVFHLAAVVSAAAEADYDLGQRVNLQGTQAVIAACRRLAKPPRVVFTSSVASFSGGQAARLEDWARQVPTNSYGTQKAAAELLLADATRRGFVDAVSIRLPTVIVRPGRPNKAASSFVSAIIREPLLGLATDLPVGEDFAVWICSPTSAVAWLMHAAGMESLLLGSDRGVNPPGMCITVSRMLAALEEVSPGASALVRRAPDPAIAAIVGSWPAAFAPLRAKTLGFSAHESLIDLVRAFVRDDLEATRSERNAQEGNN